ncbi:hypothetical protein [Nocardioides pakistanensis]
MSSRPQRHHAAPPQIPSGSPAFGVASFRGKPVDEWFPSGPGYAVVCPSGSYATICPDPDDEGLWHGDITHADASTDDIRANSREQAMSLCERALDCEPLPTP